MSRSPKELLEKLGKADKETADRLESVLDLALDRDYTGGVFTYSVYESLSPRVRQELNRRYADWDLSFQESRFADPYEPDCATQIRMTPSPPVPF